MAPFPYGTLGGFDTEELFIMIYLLVDRYLHDRQKHCGPLRQSKNGVTPKLTDAEVITIDLVRELRGEENHARWYFELTTTWKSWFPDLNDRTRLCRRIHDLAPVMEAFRRKLIEYLGLDEDCERFLDSKPIKLAQLGRAFQNQNKRFRPKWLKDKHAGLKVVVEPGMADIGRCATKSETYFGMKLHMMLAPSGVPTTWELTAASIDDRAPVMELLASDPLVQKGGCVRIWSDNGYQCEETERQVKETGNRLHPFPKKAKCGLWPRQLRRIIRGMRQSIETKFSEGVRFLNLQEPKAASTRGLMARMTAKMTALTLYAIASVLPALAQNTI